jgi:glycosyltransferase involved in cell wall biosynthesis
LKTPTTGTTPLVSIGLPVFNGMPYLEEAISTLLAQVGCSFELIISDNASSDGTSEYCRRQAAHDPRIRYRRNAENIGALNNFTAVLNSARGQYFMWASHDDRWNCEFASALAATLDAAPDAVLATPIVLHTNADGSMRNDPVDRPAAGEPGLANLKILCTDHAVSWIYGLYRTDWLRRHRDEMDRYPMWGFDCLWLADVSLRYKVVGSQQAMLWKRLRRSGYAPRTSRAVVAFWAYMFWYFAQTSFRRGRNRREQLTILAISWSYVYRLCIQRPNLPRTVWRVVRMVTLAALTCVPAGLWNLVRRRKLPVTVSLPEMSMSETPMPEISQSGQHAIPRIASSDDISKAA